MNEGTTLGRYRIEWAGESHVGMVRRVNEDSFLARPGCFVVADGMGGHAAGDVASQLTVGAFADIDGMTLIGDLARRVGDANSAVLAHAEVSGCRGMGSTLVGAAVVENGDDLEVAVFHVGDSRCYSWDGHTVCLVTRDHSEVQELLERGEITPAEATSHPHRNVITRAIGAEHTVSTDFALLPLVPRRRLLLCSDGVSGQLDADLLAALLSDRALSPQQVVDALIGAVLDGPAPDNATALVVDLQTEAQEFPTGDEDITVQTRRRDNRETHSSPPSTARPPSDRVRVVSADTTSCIARGVS